MKKLIYIGGTKGVGKTALLRTSINGKYPIINTGQWGRNIQKYLKKKNPNWETFSRAEKFRLINLEMVDRIKRVLSKKEVLVLDSHFASKGMPIWVKETLLKLVELENTDFLLVHLDASAHDIIKRVALDIVTGKKRRTEEIEIILNDRILNEKFYSEYLDILNGYGKNAYGVKLWNDSIADTANLLRTVVSDFVCDKWKNQFLIPYSRKQNQ